jgi:hypothetical protein
MNFDATSLIVNIIEDLCAFKLVHRDSSAFKKYKSWLSTKQENGSVNLSIKMNWGTSVQVFTFKMLESQLIIEAFDYTKGEKHIWYNYDSNDEYGDVDFDSCPKEYLEQTIKRLIWTYHLNDNFRVELF